MYAKHWRIATSTEELVVELNGLAAREEDHRFLLPCSLQDLEEPPETVFGLADHVAVKHQILGIEACVSTDCTQKKT